MDYGFATKCICGNGKKYDKDKTGAISFPIYQTATYAHPAVGQSTGFDYSRLQNPTRQQAEQVVAALEGGVDALAFASGMAAITAMMELFRPGDHLITDADLYGGSIRLFDHVSEKNGITFSHIDCASEDVEPYIKGEWYGQLRAFEYFKRVSTDGFTVVWPNGQDICPDELYSLGKLVS